MHLKTLQKWFNSSDYRDIMLKGLYLSSVMIFLFLGVVSGMMGYENIFWTKLLVAFLSAAFFYSYLNQGRLHLHVLLLVLLVELDSAYVMLGEHVDNFVSIYPYFIIFGFFFFFKLKTAIGLTLMHLLYWLLVGFYGHTLFPGDAIFTMVSLANIAVCSLIAMIFAFFYYISIELSYEKLADADRQKAILLKEIHHRIKNNLNQTSSLIGLQMMQTDPDSEKESIEVLQKSKLRIEAMAMVHDALYRTKDLEKIDFKSYIENLTYHINQAYGEQIPVKVRCSEIYLSLDIMMKIGMIINELFTNTIKHSLPYADTLPYILITLESYDSEMLLVYDQSCDRPVDTASLSTATTLGMTLVRIMVEEMGGQMEIRVEKNLRFEISFTA